MQEKLKTISKKFKDAGGTAYLVGGSVRDMLLKKPVKDYDFEVHNLEPFKVKEICKSLGKVDEVGESFSVLKLKYENQTFDISVPRVEKKVAQGHKGFEVTAAPFIGTYEACRRRDFTINAILYDVLENTYIDHFKGLEDIESNTLRHVDSTTFIEDSLRVLRAVQFVGRFGFSLDHDTFAICKDIDVSDLPAERIFEEFFKMLTKAIDLKTASYYFKALDLDKKLFGCEVAPIYVEDVKSKALSLEQLFTVNLCIFFKNVSDKEFLSVLDKMKVFTLNGYNLRKQTLLVRQSEKVMTETDVFVRSFMLHLADSGVDFKVLDSYIGTLNLYIGDENIQYGLMPYIAKLGIKQNSSFKIEPLLKGQDLIDLGYKEGIDLGKLLAKAFQAQLDDLIHTKEQALKFALS